MAFLLIRLRSLKPSMGEVTKLLEYLGKENGLFSGGQKEEIGGVAQATMVDPAAFRRR